MNDDTTPEDGSGADAPIPTNGAETATDSPSPAQEPKPDDPQKPGNGRKDSTIDLPLYDLGEIIRVTRKIHSDGLETAKVDEVAKAFGYKTAGSTPFYRRLVAGRHFGLIVSSGADLTSRARDIIQPNEDGVDEKAMVAAAMNLPYFAGWAARLAGRRLNLELVTNDIERTYNLTKACARRCAEVLMESFKVAGLLLADGTVRSASSTAQPASKAPEAQPEPEDPDVQSHTLYLDRHKQRKFTIVAPLAVSTAELTRICKWLEVTMIVEEPEST